MLKEYIQQINKKTAGSPIFYIAPHIERSLGLEELLANFFILTQEENYVSACLQERGIQVLHTSTEGKSALHMLKDLHTQELIFKNSPKDPHIMVFKNSPAIGKEAREKSYVLLNVDAHIAGKIENKVTQYTLLADGGFADILPKTIIARIGETAYDELVQTIGSEFIAQLDRGHSGNGTYFITNKDEFDTLANQLQGSNIKMKFSQKLPYNFITINALASQNGTYCAGLCTQITGLTEINARKGETCGNNWNQMNISDHIRSKAITITESVGDYIYSLGFKGMFGIDFAIDGDKLYILEINARQTASIQYFTKLQIENNQIPLPMLHLMIFLDIPFDLDRSIYNEVNNLPIDASVLVVRNHEKDTITIQETFNGLYNIENMKREESAYSISEIYSKSKALLLEGNEGAIIDPDEEFFKIITRGNVMKDEAHIDENILQMVHTVLSKTKSHG